MPEWAGALRADAIGERISLGHPSIPQK
jgi:hypothetical protein